MKMIIMFDLPTETATDRKKYRIFHDILKKEGFTMIQYSIYTRTYPNKDSADYAQLRLERYIPQNGKIRILIITENQYLKMKILEPTINVKEKLLNQKDFIKI